MSDKKTFTINISPEELIELASGIRSTFHYEDVEHEIVVRSDLSRCFKPGVSMIAAKVAYTTFAAVKQLLFQKERNP